MVDLYIFLLKFKPKYEKIKQMVLGEHYKLMFIGLLHHHQDIKMLFKLS